MNNKQKTKVVVYEDINLIYPEEPPFSPTVIYPEFKASNHQLGSSPNQVYNAIRKTLASLGLDKENFGTEKWNPLKNYIPRGGNVLVKPNLVHHSTYHVGNREVVLTHGSVIRVMVDYVILACGLDGRVTIGDSPMRSAKFDKIVSSLGLDTIVEYYKEHLNFTLYIEDFRLSKSFYSNTGYFEKVAFVDANNYTDIKLSNSCHKVFESNYEMTDASNPIKTYTLHNSILTADCILNIPKLKTHKIAGITCCLKAMIGSNSNKNQILPHYKKGGSDVGGDEYFRENLLMKFKRGILKKLKKSPKFIFDMSQILFSL